jgi:tetratricopeptide (TPR) repeat protein
MSQAPDPAEQNFIGAPPQPDESSGFESMPENGKQRRGLRGLSSTAALVAIGACVLIAALGVAAWGGATAGQNERETSATQTTAADMDLQFELGLADLADGRYELAAQRFSWIVERVPGYPGAAERLAEARQGLAASSAGSADVVATAVPTSAAGGDLNLLYDEATTYFENQEWQAAITRLQDIQNEDPTFKEIDVKEMLHEALKNQGLAELRAGRFEEGVFLLDQAIDIKPLDEQAEGEYVLASFYVAGLRYWDINWPVVIENYQEIYNVMPTYYDVADRLWDAHVLYGDQLIAASDPCAASEQYLAALGMVWDVAVGEKYDDANYACLNPTPIPPDALDGTPGVMTPLAEEHAFPMPSLTPDLAGGE